MTRFNLSPKTENAEQILSSRISEIIDESRADRNHWIAGN